MKMSEEKKLLRKQMKEARAAFTGAGRAQADQAIWQKILALPQFTESPRVFAYASFGSEINTWPFLKSCLAYGKELYLPKVAGSTMIFRHVKDLSQLVPGVWGIPEPSESCPAADMTNLSKTSFVLMPGLAFDRQRRRLGYGGGYYDRTFADCTGFFFCAAAYDFQITDRVPTESWDLKASVIITESEEIK